MTGRQMPRHPRQDLSACILQAPPCGYRRPTHGCPGFADGCSPCGTFMSAIAVAWGLPSSGAGQCSRIATSAEKTDAWDLKPNCASAPAKSGTRSGCVRTCLAVSVPNGRQRVRYRSL
ncbi:unnamed protein product [Mycena citricolor]|uniref:Uncharacterized protein n=1 Tax=Mycena citricolor TaxID=2018698 RepID=A0AAD2JWW9_9AGAR|nr:unnamed protein product [Mycena citricolor]